MIADNSSYMNQNAPQTKLQVSFVTISEENATQRIDNFLITHLKGVPKSMIYRILRKGEVRVNKKRVKPEYKLNTGDEIRIPPIRIAEKSAPEISSKLNKVAELETTIIYEDDVILAINKPSGIAVHGGSGLSFGVIEGLRALRPEAKFLELVHRIDRETSGILLIAKKRSALKSLHEQLRLKQMQKSYLALVKGNWPSECKVIQAPLLKNVLKSGERVVKVDKEGKPSETRFKVEERFNFATLIKASPVTGRTHQIRVHTQYANHPIAFDDRYGDSQFDALLMKTKLNRLFLHAAKVKFIHPKTMQEMQLVAPLDKILQACLTEIRNHKYQQIDF